MFTCNTCLNHMQVGSQDLSATFPDRCHHPVLSDSVALQRTIEVP